MNAVRVRQDIAVAQKKFDYLEAHSYTSGKPYAKIALQTAQRQVYILDITFTGYPSAAPYVYVRKPTLVSSPHRYTEEGRICYMLPSKWNPGFHDVEFVVARASKWLHKYEVYRATGRWPGAGIAH